MENQYLVVCDFDGTIANTFQKSPVGVGVHEAYSYAVETIFGKEGLNIYNNIGGLQNRAPEELIAAIFKQRGNNKRLTASAKKCFNDQKEYLSGLVPEGKGVLMEWPQEQTDCAQRVISEMLVRIKMSYLMKEIGSTFLNKEIWPRPCDGILNFWESIAILNQVAGVDIQPAIVSSGHDEFIKKTFLAWGHQPPLITVTDDDMRGRNYPEEIKRRVKPSSFLFDLVHYRWLNGRKSISDSLKYIELIMNTRDKMIYFGDDIKKDGELAKNAKVPFGLFAPGIRFAKSADGGFSFGSWTEIAEFFLQEKIIKALQTGSSFIKIIGLIEA